MYSRNTEKNKFPDQHKDVAASVPTSAQGLSDMFQPSIEQLQGTCTTSEKNKFSEPS
jgi:hypothetical protein